ncbi:hypothetical protein L195_g002017 [Trifolium pratense]|uniref:Uncharacterized protein n=1 Tax=Trifolium pratense TaxID=57577 RepID=A0A2K3MZG4_TRIPR|nr:hypothetical protein L195_g019392 [Trifolium pratense]PNY05564.1 hypothetical protein L195_g002017 [Trifolium pratense]
MNQGGREGGRQDGGRMNEAAQPRQDGYRNQGGRTKTRGGSTTNSVYALAPAGFV